MGSHRRKKRRRSKSRRDCGGLSPGESPVQAAPASGRLQPALWLLAGALAVRFAHLLLYRGDFWLKTPLLDDNIFVSWADVIEREGWKASSLGIFHLNCAYPYFLAILGKTVGRGWAMVYSLQHIAGALVPPLLYWIGNRVFGRRAGLVAGVLAVLFGPALFYESRFLGEFWIYFFNTACLASLLFAYRHPRPWMGWAAAGLALGFSMVLRPNVIFFLPPVLLWALRSLPSLRESPQVLPACVLPFLLCLWLPLLPFQLRNRAVDPSRGWDLTTSSGGVNLYLGNNPEADGLNKAPQFIRYGPGHEYQDFEEEAERRTGRRMKPGEVSRYWTAQVVKWMRASPGKAAGLMARKVGFFWNHKEPPDNFFPVIFRRFTRLGPVPLVAWGLIAPLGLAGLLWSLRRTELRSWWLLHAYVGSYFAVNVLFYILSRYRFPTAAGLILFAAYALVRLYDNVSRRHWGRGAVLAALCLACFGLSRLNLIGEEDMAVSHYSMGVIYANQGWKDKAAAEYRASIAADPRFKASYSNLGILEAKRGRLPAALEALEAALRLETDTERAGAIRRFIGRIKARSARK